MKQAAILTIGNELLYGRTLNSNARFLSEKLLQWGFVVTEHRTVADEPSIITQATQVLAQTNQLLLITGGLGPTVDDCTRDVLAKLTGQPLITYPPAQMHLRERYQSRNLPLPEKNLSQAQLPEGGLPIMNNVGSALGFLLQWQQCLLVALPGVPSEMQAMVEGSLLKQLQETCSDHDFTPLPLLTCRFLGMAESQLNEWGLDWLKRLKTSEVGAIRLGTMIRFPQVHLLFSPLLTETAQASKTEVAFANLKHWIRADAAEYLIDFSTTPLEEQIGSHMVERHQTLALAESCTGGYLASRLLAVPGASSYFLGSLVTYADQAKIKLLGVAADTLKQHGAVSPECALEMARQARLLHAADIGLSTTGFLGPSGGSYDKPVGTAFGAVVTSKSHQVKRFQLTRDRIRNRDELTEQMLLWLRNQCAPQQP